MVTLDDLTNEARAHLAGVVRGEGLDAVSAALIGLAVHASVANLDTDAIERFSAQALDAGASGAQVHEVLVLVSGLGVHTLMEGSRRVAGLLAARADPEFGAPLDSRRSALWERYVGSSGYWDAMETEAPGFLEALLRQSPEAFQAFFEYCAVPWKSAALSRASKELISIAVDATPNHRYLPGMRLHLKNAIALGVGGAAILEALAIAAAVPAHPGVG
jgi:alkylhydroperoxidase/carboxymuconolactone decarboxylase family protein YurZ